LVENRKKKIKRIREWGVKKGKIGGKVNNSCDYNDNDKVKGNNNQHMEEEYEKKNDNKPTMSDNDDERGGGRRDEKVKIGKKK